MTTQKRFSQNLLPLWLLVIGLGILDIVLFLWTLSGNGYKSACAVPVVTGFFLFLLAILLLGRTDQALGRKIQAARDAARGEEPPEVEQAIEPSEAHAVLPVPAFSIEMLRAGNLPQLYRMPRRSSNAGGASTRKDCKSTVGEYGSSCWRTW